MKMNQKQGICMPYEIKRRHVEEHLLVGEPFDKNHIPVPHSI